MEKERSLPQQEMTMNRIATLALFAAAALVSAGSAMAQDHGVAVNVPFDFTINNTSLPAGNYTVGTDVDHPHMLVLRDQKNTVKALGVGMYDVEQPGKSGSLVFHQYGEQYFLSEIRFGHDSKAIYFPATREEKRARRLSRKETVTAPASQGE
jgi:hypothetical protein